MLMSHQIVFLHHLTNMTHHTVSVTSYEVLTHLNKTTLIAGYIYLLLSFKS